MGDLGMCLRARLYARHRAVFNIWTTHGMTPSPLLVLLLNLQSLLDLYTIQREIGRLENFKIGEGLSRGLRCVLGNRASRQQTCGW